MNAAVRCGRCGVRYHSRYDRCPRCRAREPRPVQDRPRRGEPAATAGTTSRRRFAGGAFAAVAAGAILLLTGWVWGPIPSANASSAPGGDGPLAALMRVGPPRRAAAAAEQVPRELPFIEPALAGKLAYSNGELDQALAMFQEEIAAHPSDAESQSNAAQVLVRLGRPAEALPLLERAVELDENRWAYRFNLARCRGLLGEWTRAAVDYEAADALFPGDYATLFNLGQALHRAGREEEAVRRYREAIARRPDDPTFHLALAISEERLGQRAEAAAAYRLFVQLSPEADEAAAVRARAERLESEAAASPAPAPTTTAASAQ